VVVSSASCGEVKPMPRLRRPDTMAMSSWMERPSRSSDGTTSVSPSRRKPRAFHSSSRPAFLPGFLSAKIRMHRLQSARGSAGRATAPWWTHVRIPRGRRSVRPERVRGDRRCRRPGVAAPARSYRKRCSSSS
jgi:hypothetical protein